MSDQSDDIKNDDTVKSGNEEDPESNILNSKTATILAIFLIAVIIIGFVISFINFQIAANKGDHVKYFWIELNIPKGYPDTVYKERIIYLDTIPVVHDSVRHDTVVKEIKVVQQASRSFDKDYTRAVAARQENTPANATAHPGEPHHLSDEDKSAIVSQIESLKKANNIKSDEIEIAHVYHTNGTIFMQELEDFLRSKSYKPDDGGGSRMIFGNAGRRGWWVNLKPETKKIMIGIGMF